MMGSAPPDDQQMISRGSAEGWSSDAVENPTLSEKDAVEIRLSLGSIFECFLSNFQRMRHMRQLVASAN
jgi:hypothetical protein